MSLEQTFDFLLTFDFKCFTPELYYCHSTFVAVKFHCLKIKGYSNPGHSSFRDLSINELTGLTAKCRFLHHLMSCKCLLVILHSQPILNCNWIYKNLICKCSWIYVFTLNICVKNEITFRVKFQSDSFLDTRIQVVMF